MSITKFEYKSGFPAVHLTHQNGKASAEILLYGAHILSWTVNDNNLIFLSDQAIFQQGKAIRGGVPVVWPQFGPNGPLPQHGFARVKTWRLGEIDNVDQSTGDVAVQLHLSHDDETIKVWPHKFDLTVTVRLSQDSLYQELSVNNRDDHTFDFTALFHTYFTVNDIRSTKITGLKHVTYVDKVDEGKTKTETNDVIEFKGETDRIYQDGGQHGNRIRIDNHLELIGSATMSDIVVWNPGSEKAAKSTDIGEHNYPKFVCVEVGHVNDSVKLDKGQSWKGSQEIKLIK